jgi:hypothetical protein
LTGPSDTMTQTHSNPKFLISPSTSSQNLGNTKNSSSSATPNIPLNMPVGMYHCSLYYTTVDKQHWKSKKLHFVFNENVLQISLK